MTCNKFSSFMHKRTIQITFDFSLFTPNETFPYHEQALELGLYYQKQIGTTANVYNMLNQHLVLIFIIQSIVVVALAKRMVPVNCNTCCRNTNTLQMDRRAIFCWYQHCSCTLQNDISSNVNSRNYCRSTAGTGKERVSQSTSLESVDWSSGQIYHFQLRSMLRPMEYSCWRCYGYFHKLYPSFCKKKVVRFCIYEIMIEFTSLILIYFADE